MPAEVKKIRDDVQADPKMIVGMLNGYAGQIKHIAAVVIWDDDSFQIINDPMPLSKLAYAVAVMDRELRRGMDDPN